MLPEVSSQCYSPFYLWPEGSGICGRAREAEKQVFVNGSKANVYGSDQEYSVAERAQ